MKWFLSHRRGLAGAAILVATFGGHVALSHGWTGLATVLAAVQAVAAGPLLWPALPPRWRPLAIAVPLVLLAGLLAGSVRSERDGALAVAGLGHAMLYGGLLTWFGGSLRPGRISLVTGLAMRLNPRFRPDMIPYTRAVTATWCGFCVAQLIGSAALLTMAPVSWWLLLVGTLHVPMAIGLGLAEFAARAWRFRGEQTGLRDTVIGMRRGAWRASPAAAADTSVPAADCPGHSGNATRHPAPGSDSALGPAR